MSRLSVSLDDKIKENFNETVENGDFNRSSVVESLIEIWLEKMDETENHHSRVLDELQDIDLS